MSSKDDSDVPVSIISNDATSEHGQDDIDKESDIPVDIVSNGDDNLKNISVDISDGTLDDASVDASTSNNTLDDPSNDTTNDTPDNTVDNTTNGNSSTKDLNNALNTSDSVESSTTSDEHKPNYDELAAQLESQIIKTSDYETKLQHALADYENLLKKTQHDIKNGIDAQIDKFILDFLDIYDDFVRAKEAFAQNQVDTKGLDGILKNMDALLKRYNTTPIDALGEMFDPIYHESISSTIDSSLDDGTIVQELRKGYISQSRVIRPTLVKISKKE